MAPILYISLHAESYDVSDNITGYVRSAWSQAAHISKSGLIIAGQSGMDGGNNVIRLPDKTTFNWKSKDRVVRVNCKEHAMKLIEGNTKLHHFENGYADPSRPFSFFISTYSYLVACLVALNKEEYNRI